MRTGEVRQRNRYGEHYHSLWIEAPEVAGRTEAGQFVNVRCGRERSFILRRPFSVSRLDGGALEIVFDANGPGTRYLSELDAGAPVELLGPLGRGFSIPQRPTSCLLVGGGIGSAPLFVLADTLVSHGHRVDFILGARHEGLLLGAREAQALSERCILTTDDGSAGERGLVTDVLAGAVESCGTQIVYACGPQPMLEAVSRECARIGARVEVAVEELMACGYGVCMTCVMPLRRTSAGGEREVVNVRSCTEGPVFDGSAIAWHGALEEPAAPERELAPSGASPARSTSAAPADEHAPPGN